MLDARVTAHPPAVDLMGLRLFEFIKRFLDFENGEETCLTDGADHLNVIVNVKSVSKRGLVNRRLF